MMQVSVLSKYYRILKILLLPLPNCHPCYFNVIPVTDSGVTVTGMTVTGMTIMTFSPLQR